MTGDSNQDHQADQKGRRCAPGCVSRLAAAACRAVDPGPAARPRGLLAPGPGPRARPGRAGGRGLGAFRRRSSHS